MSSEPVRKEEQDNKPAKKISEETLQMVANIIITTISTAALAISIATGMKNKRIK
ncbi:MAG: hypothetical protein IKE85_04975 [Mogibacterium sp.]|nr:hypothetical protein [Mogibacterium sp.]MBR2540167.1 hypothetical protein [Mogibacterium sp.]